MVTRPRLAPLLRTRAGNMALMATLLMPAMLGAVGMGAEVTYWAEQQTEVQRIADAAAMAAAQAYLANPNSTIATGIAASMAEVNGIAGATSRNWDATTGILTDGTITVAVVPGLKQSTDTAFKVVIQQNIPTLISRLFTRLASMPVAAMAIAENVASPSTQPCLVALSHGANPITITNGANVTATGCAVRSNGGLSISGGAMLSDSGTYLGGTLTQSNGAHVYGAVYQNDGTIPDPYAADPAMQTALAKLSPGQGPAMNETSTWPAPAPISPGTYSSLTISNGVSTTLQPGLYVINGPINFGGGATITGTGVTIVTSGTINWNNGAHITLSAPTKDATGGVVPGVLIAGTSTATSELAGGIQPTLTGVVYYPNGPINMSNGIGTSSTQCLEFIVNTLPISGGANLQASCSNYGALSFGANNSTVATLVQ